MVAKTVNSDGNREFQYYGAVRATNSCLNCHNEHWANASRKAS